MKKSRVVPDVLWSYEAANEPIWDLDAQSAANVTKCSCGVLHFIYLSFSDGWLKGHESKTHVKNTCSSAGRPSITLMGSGKNVRA